MISVENKTGLALGDLALAINAIWEDGDRDIRITYPPKPDEWFLMRGYVDDRAPGFVNAYGACCVVEGDRNE